MYREPGIYQIRNILDNSIYIGSTIDLVKRRDRHFSELSLGKHYNGHLQRAYNKYGKENFIFEILIICPKELLSWYEQQFVDQWKPEYNQRKDVTSNFGIKRTEEYKKMVGDFHRGKSLSNTHRKNIGIAVRLKHPIRSKTGFKGVTILPNGKYRAMAKIEGKQKHLGCFDSPEEASKVYQKTVDNVIFGGGYQDL